MTNYTLNEAKNRWQTAFSNKKFVATFLIAIVLFTCQMSFISKYQSEIELRPGVQFTDPVFGEIPALAADTLIFFAIYTTQLIALCVALSNPVKILQLVLGYFFVYFFRIFALYLLPLEPPAGTLPLIDPLLIWFGNGDIITKDLFYSGHTATTFMVILVTESKRIRYLLLIGLAFVIFGILLQRVHYTVDVYAALFFAYTSYRLTVIFLKKIKLMAP